MSIDIELLILIGIAAIVILGSACIFIIAKILNARRKIRTKVKQARKEKIEW